eukprot:4846546-Pleurochrysis_carterae.AAC.6
MAEDGLTKERVQRSNFVRNELAWAWPERSELPSWPGVFSSASACDEFEIFHGTHLENSTGSFASVMPADGRLIARVSIPCTTPTFKVKLQLSQSLLGYSGKNGKAYFATILALDLCATAALAGTLLSWHSSVLTVALPFVSARGGACIYGVALRHWCILGCRRRN